jgi:hypothetical protein
MSFFPDGKSPRLVHRADGPLGKVSVKSCKSDAVVVLKEILLEGPSARTDMTHGVRQLPPWSSPPRRAGISQAEPTNRARREAKNKLLPHGGQYHANASASEADSGEEASGEAGGGSEGSWAEDH